MWPEVPLQHDMFTGELVDRRTSAQKALDEARYQPQQMALFSQRDIAQFGVRAHPVMPFSPGPLVLISEDPRTEAEIEADTQRAAESLTGKLFGDMPDLYPDPETDGEGDATVGEEHCENETAEEPIAIPESTPPTKLTAYLELIQAVQEQGTTLWIDPAYQSTFYSHLARVLLSARATGLIESEITAAIQIGAHRGDNQRETTPTPVNTVLFDARRQRRRQRARVIGFRARQRQQSPNIRRRNPAA